MEGNGTGRGRRTKEAEGEREAVLTLGYAWILCSDRERGMDGLQERVGGWTGERVRG